MYFDGLGNFITFLLIVVAISVPLAICKLLEIIVWIYNNVNITIV